MSSLEAVTQELQELKYIEEVDIESSFERNEAILGLIEKNDDMLIVLRSIETILFDVLNRVPEAIVAGIDKTLESVTDTFTDTVRFTQTEQRRDETGGSPSNNGEGKTSKGFFAGNWEKGKKNADDFKFKGFGPIEKTLLVVGETIQTIAAAQALFKTFAMKIKTLGTRLLAISRSFLRKLPILSGLYQLFKDFDDIINSDESTLGKLKLALKSFSEGVIYPFTAVMGWIMSIAGSIGGLLGFKDFEETMKSFDAGEAAKKLASAGVDALENVLKALLGTLAGVAADVLEYLGFTSLASGLRDTETEYLENNAALETDDAFEGNVAKQAEATQELVKSGEASSEVTEEQKMDASGPLQSAIDNGFYKPPTDGWFGSSRGHITKTIGDASKPELEAILTQQDLGEHERLHVEKLLISKGGKVSILPKNTLEKSMATQTSSIEESSSGTVTKTESKKIGKGTVAEAIASPEMPMSVLSVPSYEAPSASPSNLFESYTENMKIQQRRLDNTMNQESSKSASVAMVNAPSTTNVSNNTTQYQGGSIVVSNPVDNTVSNYRR